MTTRDEPTSARDEGAWPELTYRYVKHYFWEPQHLGLTDASRRAIEASGKRREAVVDARLRKQEVPLNYLLNVLLRILPASYRKALLPAFGVDSAADPGLDALALRFPVDLESMSADVQLESETSRVFIEVKVDAPLGLPQLEKYIAGHRTLDLQAGHVTRHYLLLLVKKDLLRLKGVAKAIPLDDVPHDLAGRLGADAAGVTFGAASWPQFAASLAALRDSRRGVSPDLDEMLNTLIGDFLQTLRERELTA